jgi:hypothetical protein
MRDILTKQRLSRDHEYTYEDWLVAVRQSEREHRLAEARFARRSRGLGLLVTILSAAVGTTLFTSISNSPSMALKITAGALSLAATITAAVQTFMNYGQVSAQHHAAEAKFGELRRDIESTMLKDVAASDLEKWKQEWNKAEEGEPDVPEDLERRAEETMAHLQAYGTALGRNGDGAVPSVMGHPDA